MYSWLYVDSHLDFDWALYEHYWKFPIDMYIYLDKSKVNLHYNSQHNVMGTYLFTKIE